MAPIMGTHALTTHTPSLLTSSDATNTRAQKSAHSLYSVYSRVSLVSRLPSVPHPEMSMVRSPCSLPLSLSAVSDRQLAAGEQVG